jgi:hypothetical protein
MAFGGMLGSALAGADLRLRPKSVPERFAAIGIKPRQG